MTFGVLFVCTGNLCRSPAAQAVLQARVDAAGAGADFNIGSAGLGVGRGAAAGLRIDRTVETLLAKRGIALAPDFRSRPVTGPQIDEADLLLAATREHRLQIGKLWPDAYARTFTVREAAWMLGSRPVPADRQAAPAVRDWLANERGMTVVPPAELDIDDPIGRRTGVYRRVVDQVTAAVDVIGTALLGEEPLSRR